MGERGSPTKRVTGSWLAVASVAALVAFGALLLRNLQHGDATPDAALSTQPRAKTLVPAPSAPKAAAGARRQALLQAITKARRARQAQTPPAEHPSGARPTPPAAGSTEDASLSTAYLRKVKDTVMATRPLLEQCLEAARARNPATKPDNLWLQVTLAAEQSVAGLVEEAEISEGTFAEDAALRECLHETLYAMEFPPPETGGTTAVAFPLSPPKQPPKVIRED